VSCTVLCPSPVPTQRADIADAHHYSIGIVQVVPLDVAEDAIRGMVAGKRSVIPGLVPKAVSLGRRFTPRGVLLPASRIGRQIRG
jgi:uncharacterized protein